MPATVNPSTVITAATAARIQYDALRRGELPIWTVYERPSDHPALYVARPFIAGQGALPLHLEGRSLNHVREQLPEGLYRQPRQPGDDPVIVEVWF